MARHNGKNGTVTLGGTAVVALTGFDIDESVAIQPVGGCGDDWTGKLVGIGDWKGNIKLNADHGADGQTLRPGDALAFEGYTEGNASGKTYFSGNIVIASHGVDSPYDGIVTRSYAFEGDGALSIATVV